MFSLAEIAATVIEVFPQLLEIPLLGRILSAFRQVPFNDARQIEALQSSADKNKATRTKLKRENNKHVIKVNDAMQCVEDQLADGRLAWTLFKSFGSVLAGNASDAADVTMQQIFDCMKRKTLSQRSTRVHEPTKTGYTRSPSGHGRGNRNNLRRGS